MISKADRYRSEVRIMIKTDRPLTTGSRSAKSGLASHVSGMRHTFLNFIK